jgi:hypothetical protein
MLVWDVLTLASKLCLVEWGLACEREFLSLTGLEPAPLTLRRQVRENEEAKSGNYSLLCTADNYCRNKSLN